MSVELLSRPGADLEGALPRVAREASTRGNRYDVIECVDVDADGRLSVGGRYQAVLLPYTLRPAGPAGGGWSAGEVDEGQVIATSSSFRGAVNRAALHFAPESVKQHRLARRRQWKAEKRAAVQVPQVRQDIPGGWRAHSACRQRPDVDFFPEAGESARPALQVCRQCPVQAWCLADALDAGGTTKQFGVFGGMTPLQRMTLQRQGVTGEQVRAMGADGLPTLHARAPYRKSAGGQK